MDGLVCSANESVELLQNCCISANQLGFSQNRSVQSVLGGDKHESGDGSGSFEA